MHRSNLVKLLSKSCGRRDAILGGGALAAAGTAALWQPTSAARGWCRSDPLVRIGDELAYIICTAPRTIRQAVTGPTEIVVTLPQGVEAKLVAAGSSFGEGETVRFEYAGESVDSGLELAVRVEARVPASEDLPIGVEFARRTRGGHKDPYRAEGRTNLWIALSASI